MGVVIVILVIGIIAYFFMKSKGSSKSLLGGSSTPMLGVISHWGQLLPFQSHSADDFYSQIEQNIKAHAMPDVTTERVNQKEGGLLSASREYFRIKRADLIFEVCAAPFGKDFFVSWWLYETEGIMSQLLKYTKVGSYLKERKAKKTFYQADIESMFRSCAHQCILEAVDVLTKDGTYRLSELDRQPKDGGY